MTFPCPPAGHGRSLSSIAKRPRLSSFRAVALSIVLCFLLGSPVTAATYTGTNTGAIADGTNPNRVCGAPRDIQFLVAGFAGGIGSASVSFTMTPQHTWVGDLRVSLIAPDLTEHLLFDRVGANNATDNGDNSNLDGTYTFNDFATANFWTAAAAGGNGFDLASGSYRTQASGPFANDSPGPAFTSINSAFSVMNPANVNGIWTLRFLDCAGGDTGTVSAASMTLIPTAAGEVSLSGRVLTASGAGLRNALVTISGGSLTQPQTVATGTFGRYSFEGLDAGQTYIVSVAARRFTFPTSAVLVSLDDNLSEVNFVSNQ